MPSHMVCRNRVEDFEVWYGIFSSHAEAHREAGLVLEHLWRDDAEPNEVVYVFRIEDEQAARAFIAAPDAADAAKEAGVVDGEFRFVSPAGRPYGG